jgi:hypothetical protein
VATRAALRPTSQVRGPAGLAVTRARPSWMQGDARPKWPNFPTPPTFLRATVRVFTLTAPRHRRRRRPSSAIAEPPSLLAQPPLQPSPLAPWIFVFLAWRSWVQTWRAAGGAPARSDELRSSRPSLQAGAQRICPLLTVWAPFSGGGSPPSAMKTKPPPSARPGGGSALRGRLAAVQEGGLAQGWAAPPVVGLVRRCRGKNTMN